MLAAGRYRSARLLAARTCFPRLPSRSMAACWIR